MAMIRAVRINFEPSVNPSSATSNSFSITSRTRRNASAWSGAPAAINAISPQSMKAENKVI
jgi:hypothetical protein